MESDSGQQPQLDPRGLSNRATTFGSIAIFALVLVLGSILVPNYLRANSHQKLMSCRSNLKNIATALEIYGADHSGELPRQLRDLVPSYLKSMPSCPVAGRDTYSETFQVSTAGFVEPGLTPRFRLHCEGIHHLPMAPENCPAYDSENGMRDTTL